VKVNPVQVEASATAVAVEATVVAEDMAVVAHVVVEDPEAIVVHASSKKFAENIPCAIA
jgi:hypothetical protein